MVGCWIGKVDDSNLGRDDLANNEVVIEGDTIVLLYSKFGTGASADTVACHFRIVNIYENYYNKWFMSKQPFKKWGREAKPYKLEVCMLKQNVLDKYTDEDLCGGSVYGDDEICKVVEDEAILNVVGILQQRIVVPSKCL